MKSFLSLIMSILLLAGCGKPFAQVPPKAEAGAQFSASRGVSIPETMRKSLGLDVLDVGEAKLYPSVELALHLVRGAGDLRQISRNGGEVEASGWITEKQAASLKPGQTGRLLLPDGQTASGTVVGLDRTADPALGDFEIVVRTDAALETGMRIKAVFDAPATGEVVAVPAKAIIKTAEGEFVYVVNEGCFKRVPVKTGARSDQAVEILDGLYSGDQIAASQVVSLWMTELQSLRAGQSCCKGH